MMNTGNNRPMPATDIFALLSGNSGRVRGLNVGGHGQRNGGSISRHSIGHALRGASVVSVASVSATSASSCTSVQCTPHRRPLPSHQLSDKSENENTPLDLENRVKITKEDEVKPIPHARKEEEEEEDRRGDDGKEPGEGDCADDHAAVVAVTNDEKRTVEKKGGKDVKKNVVQIKSENLEIPPPKRNELKKLSWERRKYDCVRHPTVAEVSHEVTSVVRRGTTNTNTNINTNITTSTIESHMDYADATKAEIEERQRQKEDGDNRKNRRNNSTLTSSSSFRRGKRNRGVRGAFVWRLTDNPLDCDDTQHYGFDKRDVRTVQYRKYHAEVQQHKAIVAEGTTFFRQQMEWVLSHATQAQQNNTAASSSSSSSSPSVETFKVKVEEERIEIDEEEEEEDECPSIDLAAVDPQSASPLGKNEKEDNEGKETTERKEAVTTTTITESYVEWDKLTGKHRRRPTSTGKGGSSQRQHGCHPAQQSSTVMVDYPVTVKVTYFRPIDYNMADHRRMRSATICLLDADVAQAKVEVARQMQKHVSSVEDNGDDATQQQQQHIIAEEEQQKFTAVISQQQQQLASSSSTTHPSNDIRGGRKHKHGSGGKNLQLQEEDYGSVPWPPPGVLLQSFHVLTAVSSTETETTKQKAGGDGGNSAAIPASVSSLEVDEAQTPRRRLGRPPKPKGKLQPWNKGLKGYKNKNSKSAAGKLRQKRQRRVTRTRQEQRQWLRTTSTDDAGSNDSSDATDDEDEDSDEDEALDDGDVESESASACTAEEDEEDESEEEEEETDTESDDDSETELRLDESLFSLPQFILHHSVPEQQQVITTTTGLESVEAAKTHGTKKNLDDDMTVTAAATGNRILGVGSDTDVKQEEKESEKIITKMYTIGSFLTPPPVSTSTHNNSTDHHTDDHHQTEPTTRKTTSTTTTTTTATAIATHSQQQEQQQPHQGGEPSRRYIIRGKGSRQLVEIERGRKEMQQETKRKREQDDHLMSRTSISIPHSYSDHCSNSIISGEGDGDDSSVTASSPSKGKDKTKKQTNDTTKKRRRDQPDIGEDLAMRFRLGSDSGGAREHHHHDDHLDRDNSCDCDPFSNTSIMQYLNLNAASGAAVASSSSSSSSPPLLLSSPSSSTSASTSQYFYQNQIQNRDAAFVLQPRVPSTELEPQFGPLFSLFDFLDLKAYNERKKVKQQQRDIEHNLSIEGQEKEEDEDARHQNEDEEEGRGTAQSLSSLALRLSHQHQQTRREEKKNAMHLSNTCANRFNNNTRKLSLGKKNEGKSTSTSTTADDNATSATATATAPAAATIGDDDDNKAVAAAETRHAKLISHLLPGEPTLWGFMSLSGAAREGVLCALEQTRLNTIPVVREEESETTTSDISNNNTNNKAAESESVDLQQFHQKNDEEVATTKEEGHQEEEEDKKKPRQQEPHNSISMKAGVEWSPASADNGGHKLKSIEMSATIDSCTEDKTSSLSLPCKKRGRPPKKKHQQQQQQVIFISSQPSTQEYHGEEEEEEEEQDLLLVPPSLGRKEEKDDDGSDDSDDDEKKVGQEGDGNNDDDDDDGLFGPRAVSNLTCPQCVHHLQSHWECRRPPPPTRRGRPTKLKTRNQKTKNGTGGTPTKVSASSYIGSDDDFTCDGCGSYLPPKGDTNSPVSGWYGCRVCDYDICPKCVMQRILTDDTNTNASSDFSSAVENNQSKPAAKSRGNAKKKNKKK